MATTISSDRFAAIIAAARLKKQNESSSVGISIYPSLVPASTSTISNAVEELIESSENLGSSTTDKYGNQITYNSAQQRFIDLASSGVSCCLIGAAGTGKTTCMKGTVAALTQNPTTGILQNHDHKHLPNASRRQS